MSVICDPVQSRTVAHPCFPVYKARCAARRRASKRIDNTIVALQFVSNIRFQIRTIYAEYRQEIACQVCVCARVWLSSPLGGVILWKMEFSETQRQGLLWPGIQPDNSNSKP